jgi:hypothetical protein
MPTGKCHTFANFEQRRASAMRHPPAIVPMVIGANIELTQCTPGRAQLSKHMFVQCRKQKGLHLTSAH